MVKTVNKVIKKEIRKDFDEYYMKGDFWTSCIQHLNEIELTLADKDGHIFDFNIVYFSYTNHRGKQAKLFLPTSGGYTRALKVVKELENAEDLTLYNNSGELK
jgi:hypothetical protein